MFKLARWCYLIYAALAAFITALKGFFYAHLLDEVQYAGVNYYLLILGVGVLLVSSGVMVRCHTEMPLLAKRATLNQLTDFVRRVKGTGFLYWLVFCALVPFVGRVVAIDLSLQTLSAVQVLIFFLFTVDLMLVKSRLDFLGYAKQLFLRNLVIAVAGFVSAYFTVSAVTTVAAEVCCAALIYYRGLLSFVRGLQIPGFEFLRQSISYMPVTLVGALLQFVDRLLASSVLGAEEFSRFSYFSLIVMAGLSVQQLVNTRVITILPGICERGGREGYRYVVKVSLVMGAFLLVALTMGMLLLQSPWFAADWLKRDYSLGLAFVFMALVRSVDFYSAYLLVMGRKVLLFKVQFSVLLLFFIGVIPLKLGFISMDMLDFIATMSFGFLVLLLALAILAWSIRDDVKSV
ncbi:hypothetical protein LF841_20550 [Pseudomonas aeruginosa]|uniref:hypothetical protein n=1 Tax=Pseudomonas aeruginosa TaxID=287 RepID=UPI00209CC535|nr:hypothetical protein [Pseudomonas aeruginosa]EME5357386.1 hypothetical protein [Pseudomonas aeruginosa]MCO5624345.1 hypothetical protein [Pseudomonas aeruginosa]